MNDFLQSLRTGSMHSPRSGMTRKVYDHTYHSANQQYQYYNTSAEKVNQSYPAGQYMSSPKEDPSASLLLNSIQSLSKQIGKLAENQTYFIDVQEKTSDMIERQTLAMERIIRHLELSPKKSA